MKTTQTHPQQSKRSRVTILLALLLLSTLNSQLSTALAQGTAFTYQGRLTENGSPAQGIYDLRVTIYDSGGNSGGNVIAGPLNVAAVPVSNGLFTTTFDFGSGVFNGNARWLEIGVRTNGSLALPQLLLPRQAVTATPYAIQAAGISGPLPDAQLSANIPRLSSSIAFTSSVSFSPASGSPFTITGSSSNKLVKGLNADKLAGKDVTNFVLRAGDTMTGPLNLPTNGLAVGSDQLVLANGRVGIGTANPTGILDVRPSDATTGAGRSVIIKAQKGAANNVGGNLLLSSGDNGVDAANGHIGFGIGAAVSGSAFSVNEKMRISNNGNVGIGTTTPWAKMTISGKASPYQVYNDDPVLLLSNTNALRAADEGVSLGFNRGSHFLYGAIKGAASNADPDKFDGYLAFFTTDFTSAHLEYMRILGNGNVGIRTTDPTSALEVVGAIRTTRAGTPGQYITQFADAAGSHIRASASSGAISLGVTGDYLSVLDGGNVGIGTTSPQAKLDIANGSVRVDISSSFAPNGSTYAADGNISGDNYPFGLSTTHHGDGGVGWPQTYGAVFTVKQRTIRMFQFDVNSDDPASGTFLRSFYSPNWSPFRKLHVEGDAGVPGNAIFAGNVGIGTLTPSTSLEVVSGDASGPVAIFKQSNPANLGRIVIDSPTDDASRPSLITLRRAGIDRWSVGGIYGSDSFGIGTDSTVSNQKMVVTPGGNVGIGVTEPSEKLHVLGSVMAEGRVVMKGTASGGHQYEWYPDGPSTGALGLFDRTAGAYALAVTSAGNVGIGTGIPGSKLEVAGTITCTTLVQTSDRNAKEHFSHLNAKSVLEKVVALPITQWNFKEDATTRHLGPMAQDFHAAFGLGADDKHIATVDADGVALAAIQGLNQKLEERLNEKAVEIETLKKRLDRLEKLLSSPAHGQEGHAE